MYPGTSGGGGRASTRIGRAGMPVQNGILPADHPTRCGLDRLGRTATDLRCPGSTTEMTARSLDRFFTVVLVLSPKLHGLVSIASLSSQRLIVPSRDGPAFFGDRRRTSRSLSTARGALREDTGPQSWNNSPGCEVPWGEPRAIDCHDDTHPRRLLSAPSSSEPASVSVGATRSTKPEIHLHHSVPGPLGQHPSRISPSSTPPRQRPIARAPASDSRRRAGCVRLPSCATRVTSHML